MGVEFGSIIKEWRGLRRFSQLELAHNAELSARHLSFLESGRARPSRDMVLRLSEALEMPKAIANQALTAAGFAAAFPSLPADAPDLAPVRAAISSMLKNHAPFPAFVIDRGWTLVDANAPALELFARLAPQTDSAITQPNIVEFVITLAETDFIANWEETAALTLARVRAEIAQLGADQALEALARRLAGHPRLKDAGPFDFDQAVVPTTFVLDGEKISVFSTIAQFGSVQDVFASELRVELVFPADDASREYFERSAG